MRWVFAVLIGMIGATTALADSKSPLRAQLQSTVLRTREFAPTEVEVSFKWDGFNLLEGRLELVLKDGNETLGIYRVPDIALTTGTQTFRLLLPSLQTQMTRWQPEAQLYFVSAKQTFDLGRFSLSVPGMTGRVLVIAYSAEARRQYDEGEGEFKIMQSIRLDRFNPLPAESRQVVTTTMRSAPEDFPVSPLAYCNYDVLFLAGEGFGLLKEKQLNAIRRWVEAGGSICVLPAHGLKSYHAEFLNALIGSSESSTSIVLDAEGQPHSDLPSFRDGIGQFHCGLGRAVVVLRALDLERDLNSPAWRAAVAFLWKMHAGEIKRIAQSGRWETIENVKARVLAHPDMPKLAPTMPLVPLPGRPGAYIIPVGSQPIPQPAEQERVRKKLQLLVEQEGQALTPTEQEEIVKELLPFTGYIIKGNPISQPANLPSALTELVRTLMPKTVRLMPFSLLALILALFLVAIGPVDYFLLGWLKRRKYTWVLFSATSVGFTLFTVYLSGRYLGHVDHRNALVIVDVGKGGRVLRVNRYEAIFLARDRMVMTRAQNSLFTPIDHRRIVADEYSRAYGYNYSSTQSTSVERPVYEGRFPTQFQVIQQVRQWSLQLNRSLSLETSAEVPAVPWDLAENVVELNHPDERLLEKKPANAAFYCYRQGKLVWQRTGTQSFLSETLLHALCLPRQENQLNLVPQKQQEELFTIVSQISPAGGSSFEDLALLDPTDPKQWLLIVVTQRDNEVRVYRRLYYGN